MPNMRLQNAIATKVRLRDFFLGQDISSQTELTDEEIDVFYQAQYYMEIDMRARGFDALPMRAFITFVISDTVELVLTDPETIGNALHLIILHAHKWRKEKITWNAMLVVILEEMCHCYYCISDELEVKERVTEVVQRIHPEQTMHRLYAWAAIPE